MAGGKFGRARGLEQRFNLVASKLRCQARWYCHGLAGAKRDAIFGRQR